MTNFLNQISRIAVAAVIIATVALLSGCASTISAERRLDLWSVGESKDLVLVRGVRPLNDSDTDRLCAEGILPANLKNAAEKEKFIAFMLKEVCPNISEWRWISGFTKSDFGKGAVLARGLIRPGLIVEVNDIVESTTYQGEDGRAIRPNLVTRVIRKNALKERDPTCYWDGQSGRFDAFATGGVVCPAEGWDWRDQKWAKK